MPVDKQIVLRPRFKMELEHPHETVLKHFEESKKTNEAFKIVRVDDHVFIRLPKHKQTFWSPQLHLEINELDPQRSRLHGLFGPNPTVWTMFMFLHFLVAGLFIAFGIWTYTNWKLNNSYGFPLAMAVFMVIAWFVLYAAGRWGRTKGKTEMINLYEYMNDLLRQHQII